MAYLDNLLLGLALSGVISTLAYRRESLAPGGVIGAMIVGTIIFGLGRRCSF